MIPVQMENDAAKRYLWIIGGHFRAARPILCLLLALAGSFPAQGAEIHKAVIKGNLNKVAALLKDHPEQIESKNDQGRTPLHLAVIHNKVEIAELLLANGADVNARDGYQQTPLIEALGVYNHDKMMRLLLTKGADVNLSDRSGMTALAYAAERGKNDDAKLLIANDANINAKLLIANNINIFVSGGTPLYLAVIGTHREMVEILLANGADPNQKVGGYTPLHFASKTSASYGQLSDPKIEELLKEYGGHE